MADNSTTKAFEEWAEEIRKMPQEIIEDSITKAVNKLIAMLEANAPISGGYLAQSIGPVLPIKKTNNGWVVEIVWEDYGSYQDAGVAGTKSGQSLGKQLGYDRDFKYTNKMPPTNVSTIGGQSLAQFAEAKGISPFAVARSIMEKGIKATKWASSVLDGGGIDDVLDEIAELIVKQYEK